MTSSCLIKSQPINFAKVSTLLLGVLLSCLLTGQESIPDWPPPDSEAKAWTRWWWHGSAVTEQGITAELETLATAGFGGVELTPIFGVIGEEAQFVDFLSEDWVGLLEHTLREAARLGMQVDMATGTGWPFGGPWVRDADAAKYLAHKSYRLVGGERLSEKLVFDQEALLRRSNSLVLEMYRRSLADGTPYASLDPAGVRAESRRSERPALAKDFLETEDLQVLAVDQIRFAGPLPLVTLMAYGDEGQVVELTDRVQADGNLDWQAPPGEWQLLALFEGLHGKMVERAAPGGEGVVIDHFSAPAIQHYLQRFSEAFEDAEVGSLRAFFNDSYEVDDAYGQANWTPDFLEAFTAKRGYDLKPYLPTLLAEGDGEEKQRVLSDVRETFSDLLLETFTASWDQWADSLGAVIRNQAHGSPANILDLYAASDIPETEGTEPLRIKFASSAAHVTGKPLVSAEAGTWLGEHFESNWANLKENLDRYYVNGVNHVVYHGTAYSPEGDEFPGRLFYAAFHANDRNPLWSEIKVINDYVARTQSLLQRGSSDNDILLYFPIHDRFATPGPELLQHFDGHGSNLDDSRVGQLGEELLRQGYAFDFISDRQLDAVSYQGGLSTGGENYRTILVPRTTYIPLPSFTKLLDLAESGASIIFQDRLPASVPGFLDHESRENTLNGLTESLSWDRIDGGMEARHGAGRILVMGQVDGALERVGIHPETLVQKGLEYHRRKFEEGTLYFIVNPTNSLTEGWVPLNAVGASAVILDPMTGKRATGRTTRYDSASLSLWLNLAPGAGTFVWVSPEAAPGDRWSYFQPSGPAQPLRGEWELSFLKGGPEIPASMILEEPRTWNDLEGNDYQSFSGTARYTVTFPRPEENAEAYVLDLGNVFETARITLNGDSLTTLIGPGYTVEIPGDLLSDQNGLTIDVSSRMMNRIIDLDRRQVFWKRFYNTNFPARRVSSRGPLGLFDAASRSPEPSGLAGPVTLTPGRFFNSY